jgi:hypothetical protein
MDLLSPTVHLQAVHGGCRGYDRMVVGFATTCATSAYHHQSCEFEPCSCRGVLDITLCDKVCQLPVTGCWFYPSNPVSSTNKTDRHNITDILLKVAIHIINNKLQTFHERFYINIQSQAINNSLFSYQYQNSEETKNYNLNNHINFCVTGLSCDGICRRRVSI